MDIFKSFLLAIPAFIEDWIGAYDVCFKGHITTPRREALRAYVGGGAGVDFQGIANIL